MLDFGGCGGIENVLQPEASLLDLPKQQDDDPDLDEQRICRAKTKTCLPRVFRTSQSNSTENFSVPCTPPRRNSSRVCNRYCSSKCMMICGRRGPLGWLNLAGLVAVDWRARRSESFLMRCNRALVLPGFVGRKASTSSKKKKDIAFVCNSCGHDSVKWAGKCPSCGEYNSIVEMRLKLGSGQARNVSPSDFVKQRNWFNMKSTEPGTASSVTGVVSQFVPLASVQDSVADRTSFGNHELDRLFGGGLTVGSVTLFSGPPGVGKSTLLLQMCALLCGSDMNGNPYASVFDASVSAAAPHPPSVAPSTSILSPQQRQQPYSVAYVSGEEAAGQIRSRAKRLKIDAPGLLVLNETRVETILDQLEAAGDKLSASTGSEATRPPFAAVIVDSIQTLYSDASPGAAGSVGQVKDCAARMVAWAKATGVPVILVGHVTKAGDIAGPRVLEHMVDTVMQIEGEESVGAQAGDGGGGGGFNGGHRVVRCTKNRFGSTNEVGVFEMGDHGFVESRSHRMFLSHAPNGEQQGADQGGDGLQNQQLPPSGCGVGVTTEGSRALAVEVQALCTRATGPYPRHRATGLSVDRLHLVSAVLARHAQPVVRLLRPQWRGVNLSYHDVMINIVGGLRVSDPAMDCATAMAVVSSALSVPLPTATIFIGEVGLGGELRGAGRLEDRLKAASQVGFTTAYVPASSVAHRRQQQQQGDGSGKTAESAIRSITISGMKVIPARSIADVVRHVFSQPTSSNGSASRRGDDYLLGTEPRRAAPVVPRPVVPPQPYESAGEDFSDDNESLLAAAGISAERLAVLQLSAAGADASLDDEVGDHDPSPSPPSSSPSLSRPDAISTLKQAEALAGRIRRSRGGGAAVQADKTGADDDAASAFFRRNLNGGSRLAGGADSSLDDDDSGNNDAESAPGTAAEGRNNTEDEEDGPVHSRFRGMEVPERGPAGMDSTEDFDYDDDQQQVKG